MLNYGAALVAVTLVSLFIGVAVRQVNLADSSMLYLLAVLATAVGFGRGPAIFASVSAFLIFDWLFVNPQHQLTVTDPADPTVAGTDVHLTPTEWDLLKLFAANPDKVLTDRMLTEAVWGSSYPAQAHSLHVYVARLRKKLESSGQSRRRILTEPGVGYRLVTN